MKKLYTLLVLTGVAAAFIFPSAPKFSPVGKWKGRTGKKQLEMEFMADGHARISPMGDPVLVSDTITEVSYVFDATKDPAWLDISVHSRPGVPPKPAFSSFPPDMKMLGIVKVISPDEMLLAQEPNFVNPVRPKDFKDTLKVCRLVRVR